MHYHKFPKNPAREVSKQRLRAAERFLKREREKAPLFSAEIANEQPTPEKRIKDHDAGYALWHQERRDDLAKLWKTCRRIITVLRDKSPDDAAFIVEKWQKAYLPGDAGYLISLIRSRLRESWGNHMADSFIDQQKATP